MRASFRQLPIPIRKLPGSVSPKMRPKRRVRSSERGCFPGVASGRSLALGRDEDEGITKVLFDEETHRIIGCGIVGPSAGDLIAEAALAIEMGADASDIGHTIHPHPTLSETVGMAAEIVRRHDY